MPKRPRFRSKARRTDPHATVLIVDDEPAVVMFIAETVRRHGMRPLLAASGHDALALCHNYPGPIHVALIDVIMPGIPGPELRDCLREEFHGIRVLFMSGYSYEAMLRAGVSAHITEYIQKPFTPVELVGRIRASLEAAGAAGSRKS